MKLITVLGVVVVGAAAVAALGPLSVLSTATDGEVVLAKDFSRNGFEYKMKYVRPYKLGNPAPLFNPALDSSEEVYLHMAKQPAKGLTWENRVQNLKHVLNTGLDISDEDFRHMYATGLLKLSQDRRYYIDSSGEIYYETEKSQLPLGSNINV